MKSYNAGNIMSLCDIIDFTQRDEPFVLLVTDTKYDYEFVRKHTRRQAVVYN